MPRKPTEYEHKAIAIMASMMMSTSMYGLGNPTGCNGKYDRDEEPVNPEKAKARSDAKVEAARLKREKKNAKRLKNRQ